MKMRLVLLMLILKDSLTAQNSFSYYYPFDSYGSSFTTMLVERDTILLQGYFLDTIAPYLQGMAFAKIDTSGNLITYQRYFDSKGRDFAYPPLNNIIKLSDGRYLTVGITLQDDALQLVFLSPNFQVDTVFEYFANDPTVQVNWVRSAFELTDGYLVFGSAQRLSFASDGQIFKVSKDGELLWRKWYGFANKDEVIGDVLPYTDSTFIVGSFHKPFPVNSDDKKRNTWIYEVDVNGIILNEFVDPDPFSGTSGGFVIDQFQNIFYTGASIVVDQYGQHNALGRIGMLDSHFQLKWKQEFGKNLHIQTGFADMVMLGNRLIAVGSHVDSSRTISGAPNGFIAGWFGSASILGDSICEKLDTAQWFAEQGRSMGFFSMVDTLSSGSIITCGYGWFGPDGNNYREYAWLVKTSNPPCDELKVSLNEIDPRAKDWSISPNPTSGNLFIKFDKGKYYNNPSFYLFNAVGRIVKRFTIREQTSFCEIFLDGLPNGSYVLQSFNSKGQETGFEEVIIIK